MLYKYIHMTRPGTFWLDHALTPEVRAMLCAMASRMPAGGVVARYGQITEAVAQEIFETEGGNWSFVGCYPDGPRPTSWEEAKTHPHAGAVLPPDQCSRRTVADEARAQAEERLCQYPLHPKVQGFFDQFVRAYGHSSILELVGSPAVYSEGISWLTAWLLFDSPLCAGQEFSTRAVQHKDWPMARECDVVGGTTYEGCTITSMPAFDVDSDVIQEQDVIIKTSDPSDPPTFDLHVQTVGADADLADLHRDWFEVFEAEVAWWKDHLTDPANRAALGISDKEPFRPALDRARWALPGTIATGCAHTTGLRERARVIRIGEALATDPVTQQVWRDLTLAYQEALPGMRGMGLREAVYGDAAPQDPIPGHLRGMFADSQDGPDAEVHVYDTCGLPGVLPYARPGSRTYMDPAANSSARVSLDLRCSLAVARDWHRHRTLYPWHLRLVRDGSGQVQIDHHYTPMSATAKQRTPDLLRRSTEVFQRFMGDGDMMRAGLALPLGTRVHLQAQGGLRDAVYMLELRHGAVGANFEYKDQAGVALQALSQESRTTAPFDEAVVASV